MDKKEMPLATCDNVLNGIEDNTISVSSALLQCLNLPQIRSVDKVAKTKEIW